VHTSPSPAFYNSLTRVCRSIGRDPYATYNNLTLAQLYALTPNIPAEAWQSYFKYAGIPLGKPPPFGP
jgi:hypothetical protein